MNENLSVNSIYSCISLKKIELIDLCILKTISITCQKKFISQTIFTSTYHDFNGTPGNLGWDAQSLEERGLLRTETSVLWGNDDIVGCNCVGTSWGGHLVGKDQVTDLNEIFVSHDQTNISSDVWKKSV